MPQLIDVTAAINYFHSRPYLIEYYPHEGSKYRITHTDGRAPRFFQSQEYVLEYLKDELKTAPASAKARFSKAIFLQRKYKKRALELSSVEMQMIQNAIESIPNLVFSDIDMLFEFCSPDPAY